jgi:hypothetical protein
MSGIASPSTRNDNEVRHSPSRHCEAQSAEANSDIGQPRDCHALYPSPKGEG